MSQHKKLPPFLKDILNGLIVGGSMTLPGVSGGTMAIILGVYNRLISAVTNLFTEPKKSIPFLMKFGCGGVAGLLTIAQVVGKLMELFPAPLIMLFTGAIIGTVPLLFFSARGDETRRHSDSGKRQFNRKDLLCVIIGFVCLTPFALVPPNLFDFFGTPPLLKIIILLVTGFIVAVALVLPGISATQTLLMLGIYDKVLVESVRSFDIAFLLPLMVGGVAGTFLVSKAVERAVQNHTRAAYMTIAGFVLASVFELFREFAPHAEFLSAPYGSGVIICLVLLCAGFIITFTLGKTGERTYSDTTADTATDKVN